MVVIKDFRKARLFCEMTQGDVSLSTGVSVYLIAKMERDEPVDPHLRDIVKRFLQEKVEAEMQAEGEVIVNVREELQLRD